MRILIDIGHPAHVHLFRFFAIEMKKRGHKVYFSATDKEFEHYLLKSFGFEYYSLGKRYKSIIGKLFGLIYFDFKLLLYAIKIKPHILISHGSFYASHIAFLLRKPHISLEDTFNNEQVILYKYFTKAILTGNYVHPYIGKRNIKYHGYHELAYLHPNQFQPNPDIYSFLNIEQGESYTLVRFVAWDATHDIKHQGISFENKLKLVEEINKINKVFISSESPLPPELEEYKLNLPPEKIHDALSFANLIVGESATMAAEAAVLGTPAVYLDNTGRYYTKELEDKYGMVFNYSESKEDQVKAINKAIEIISIKNNKEYWAKKREILLKDKIDVTNFLAWFVENFPTSFNEMRNNPEIQFQFK